VQLGLWDFFRIVTSDRLFVPGCTGACVSRLMVAGSVCIGLFAWPIASNALGLGSIAGEAIIGEALLLEVPLTGMPERPLESSCFSLRRVPDGLDPEYFPRDLVAHVDDQAGASRLQISSRSAVRQPIVEFRVFVSCGHNLFRDYLTMAAPRGESPAPAAAPVAASASPAVVRATPAGTTSANSAIAAPVVSTATRLPDGVAGRNITLDRAMTLEQLAQQNFPGPLRQQRFMRWVVEANPQYFSGSGAKLRQQRLPAGTALVVPTGVPPRRPGDHLGNTTPLGERIEVGAEAGAASQAIPRAPVPEKNPPSAGSAKDRLVVGGGGTSTRNLKEAVALVDQLTGMMEKQLGAQNAANERIQQLETSLAELDKRLHEQEATLATRESQWQANLQAEKVAREQEAQSAWWKILGAAIAGGLIGGGVMLILRAIQGRKQGGEDEIIDLPAAEESVQVEESRQTPVEIAKPAPLTEFGWDDEPANKRSSGMPAVQAPRVVQPSGSVAPVAKPAPAVANLNQIDFELPLATSVANQPEAIDPTQAAIELANIMTSMGLADSAAQTLVEHIRENPRESLPQWLKLLEIHRHSGNRTEFERSAAELRQHFNVHPDDWNAPVQQGRSSLESYPHIRAMIVKLWRTPECVNLLRSLLLDNREGTRNGFSLAVAEEILLLIAVQSSN
jgi:pilus assembly protein FimV